MNLQQMNLATPSHNWPSKWHWNSNIHQRAPHPIQKQLTLPGFLKPTPAPLLSSIPTTPPSTDTLLPMHLPSTTDNLVDLADSQMSAAMELTPPPPPEPLPQLQMALVTENDNIPWGNIWRLNSLTNLFRVFSKNTSTINPLNIDMLAIINELWVQVCSQPRKQISTGSPLWETRFTCNVAKQPLTFSINCEQPRTLLRLVQTRRYTHSGSWTMHQLNSQLQLQSSIRSLVFYWVCRQR